MDSYIIRMYRRDAENPENLVGLVETVGEGEKRSFHSVSELVAILSEPHALRLATTQPVLKVIKSGKKTSR